MAASGQFRQAADTSTGATGSHAEEQLRGVDVAGAMVEAGLPRELAADYLASRRKLPTAAALLGQLIGIQTFRQSMARWTDLRVKTSPDTTWRYDFRWPSPFYSDLAIHCVELPFAWNLLGGDGCYRGAPASPVAVMSRRHRCSRRGG